MDIQSEVCRKMFETLGYQELCIILELVLVALIAWGHGVLTANRLERSRKTKEVQRRIKKQAPLRRKTDTLEE